MQTQQGHLAKGTTSKEFCDVMEKIQQAATMRVAPQLNPQQGEQLVYSYDNDSVHKGALEELRVRGLLTSTNRAPLPPNSPDMHKVVEHCIARVTSMVNAELADTEDSAPSGVLAGQSRAAVLYGNKRSFSEGRCG